MKNVILFFLMLSSYWALGQQNLNNKGLAIDGYDPVAYFTKSKAVKGSKKQKAEYNGAIYYFSSAKNQAMFKSNPSKYIPEYGGWCAYAMGKDGSKVAINPKTFKIVDRKLYLFYNAWGTNTLDYWNKDEASLKKAANRYWKNK